MRHKAHRATFFYMWHISHGRLTARGSFFFFNPPKTWIRPLFLDFFENQPGYAISMVHNVFQIHLKVAEHVFDIIFMFHHVFDSVWREKWARVVKMAHFR